MEPGHTNTLAETDIRRERGELQVRIDDGKIKEAQLYIATKAAEDPNEKGEDGEWTTPRMAVASRAEIYKIAGATMGWGGNIKRHCQEVFGVLPADLPARIVHLYDLYFLNVKCPYPKGKPE